MSQAASRAGMPVAIIGGFLGAGKTTLLNRVFAGDHGLRIGVIVNDFGSLAFDEELAEASTSHRRLLANGCVCCTIQNDLIETMVEMLRQEPPLDAVVVEASGVADPLSLVATFAGARLVPPVRVRSVVTVADAEQVREQEQDYGGELVVKQLRAASVVVLNKCDLVDAQELAATREWLRELGAGGTVLEAVHSDVPLDAVLGTGRIDAPAVGTSPADAHEQFDEWSLRTDRCFDADRIRRIFAQLPAAITRAKGVVELPGGQGRLLVQFAGGRLELSAVEAPAGGERGSRIVVIGSRGTVDSAALERLFQDVA